MDTSRLAHTPECRRAHHLAQQVVAGAASAQEHEELRAHLGRCSGCRRSLEGMLAAASSLAAALRAPAARFTAPPPLELPRRQAFGRTSRYRVLVDFTLLVVLGLSLLVLAAFIAAGWRALTQRRALIRCFVAVNEIHALSRDVQALVHAAATDDAALQAAEAWRRRVLDGLRDPWGAAYRMRVEGRSVRLWSPGPDGRDDGGDGDDITAATPPPAVGLFRPPPGSPPR